MKKNGFIAMIGIAAILIGGSCSKSSDYGSNNSSVEGKWTGNYGSGVGTSVNYFSVTFNSGGALSVEANSSSTPSLATGTWYISGNTVTANYTFVSGSVGTYSLAGTYTSGSSTMTGTLGTGTSTSGYAVFSVTKQ